MVNDDIRIKGKIIDGKAYRQPYCLCCSTDGIPMSLIGSGVTGKGEDYKRYKCEHGIKGVLGDTELCSVMYDLYV